MREIPLEVSQSAPDFTLSRLDGRPQALETLRGRIVILNFWSAECPWSERIDKDLIPRLSGWGDRIQLVSIASNANEPRELLRRVAAERGLPELLLDPDHRVADLYGAVSTPQFFVIDAESFLRYQGGYDDVTFRQRTPTRTYLVEAVEALLAGRAPDPAQTPAYGCTIVRMLADG